MIYFDIFLGFSVTVTAYWKHFSLLFSQFIVNFCFLSNRRNPCIIQWNLDLIYDICNTMNQHNQIQIHKNCFSLVLLIFFWYLEKRDSVSSSITLPVSFPNIVSLLSFLICYTFSSVFRRHKVNCYVKRYDIFKDICSLSLSWPIVFFQLLWKLAGTGSGLMGIWPCLKILFWIALFLMTSSETKKIAPKWPFLTQTISICQYLLPGFRSAKRKFYSN